MSLVLVGTDGPATGKYIIKYMDAETGKMFHFEVEFSDCELGVIKRSFDQTLEAASTWHKRLREGNDYGE
jgi:hypothetical protein